MSSTLWSFRMEKKKKKKNICETENGFFFSLSSSFPCAKLIENSLALFVSFGLLTFDIGLTSTFSRLDFIHFVSWKVIWYAKYQGVFWLLATAQHETFLKRSQSAEKLSLVTVRCVQQKFVDVAFGHYQFDVISFDMVLNTDGQLFHYFCLLTFWCGDRMNSSFFWIDQIKALIKFRYVQLKFDTYCISKKVNWQTVVYSVKHET